MEDCLVKSVVLAGLESGYYLILRGTMSLALMWRPCRTLGKNGISGSSQASATIPRDFSLALELTFPCLLATIAMKKRLIILSDLWGREKSEWFVNYTQILSTNFNIKYYDCCELGGIDKSDYREEKLHKQFVNGGIDRAVGNLIELEKNSISVLAFSIGGTIAWKFGIKSELIESLVGVSSTRLRHETSKPKGNIALYFGQHDANKPKVEWFDNMVLNCNILADQEHQFYQKAEFAEHICTQLITNLNETR